MGPRCQLPLDQLIAVAKKQQRKSRDNETQSTCSLSTEAGRSFVSCPSTLPSRSLSSRPALPSRSISSRSSSGRGGIIRKVSFSDESHRTYSVPKMASNRDEKRALWFSKSEYNEIKNEMFQIAKITKLDGPINETSHFSYRGLERMLSSEDISDLAKQSVLVHRDETMYALASARAVSEARQLAQSDAEDAAAYIIESFSESFSELCSKCPVSSDTDQLDEENLSRSLPRQRSLTRKNSIRRISQDPDQVMEKDFSRSLPRQRSLQYRTSSHQVDHDLVENNRNVDRYQRDDMPFRSLPKQSSLSRKKSIRHSSRDSEERGRRKVDPQAS